MCLIYEKKKTFSNEPLKPSRTKERITKKHPDKTNKNILYLKNKFEKRKTVSGILVHHKRNNGVCLIVSYRVHF